MKPLISAMTTALAKSVPRAARTKPVDSSMIRRARLGQQMSSSQKEILTAESEGSILKMSAIARGPAPTFGYSNRIQPQPDAATEVMLLSAKNTIPRVRWSRFLRQAVKVDLLTKRMIHHEDTQTVYS
jgi:hypothetical protein